MKIETKFNVGQTVYYMDNNRVAEGIIDSVQTSTSSKESGWEEVMDTTVIYTLSNCKYNATKYQQDKLFASKRDLALHLCGSEIFDIDDEGC